MATSQAAETARTSAKGFWPHVLNPVHIHPVQRWTGPDLSLITREPCHPGFHGWQGSRRSEEHTSELQSLMRNSYAVFCLKKKKKIEDMNTIQQSTTSNTHTTTQKK